MDQDETIEEPTLTETKAEEAEGHDGEDAGKVIQTFGVRITLRLNHRTDDAHEVEAAEAAVPTNDVMATAIREALYGSLPYFTFDAIHVTAEKV